MKPTHLAIPAIVALCLGCSTLRVSTDFAPGTDFKQYKTFSIKRGAIPYNPIAAERYYTGLGDALQAHGLKMVPDGGDLSVFTHFQVSKETQINTTVDGYSGWSGWGYGYGYGYGGGMQTATTTVREVPIGNLVIDIVDAKTKTAVWRGMAQDEIARGISAEDREIKMKRLFQGLFGDFPPRK